ncbi:MAG: phosphonate ABC transporter, permease protein PhnE [Desulfosalsimonadaceae bacterium]
MAKTTSSNTKLQVRTRVPASVAGVASLIVPGLGQIIIGQVQRGILILAAVVSAGGILTWRVADIARRAEGAWEKLQRSVELSPAFVILGIAFLALVWLLAAYDAYRTAKRHRRGGFALFIAILATFFVLGWQISEIDMVKMVRRAPEALPPLSRVLWPWEAAIEYETATMSDSQRILVGEGEIPEPNEPKEDEPYIIVEPTTGELSTQDMQTGDVELGTELSITGGNFEPNTVTEIWWTDVGGNEFRVRQEGEYVTVTTDSEGSFSVDVTMPYRLTPPSAVGPQYHEVAARQTSDVGRPMASEPLRFTISRMIETIFMGMMATLFGIVFAIPVSFLAARNIMQGSALTMAIYYLSRTLMNIVRSIEPLIWALIAVVWVGLGPFAGIVALTLHSVAALGKLYSEAIEGIDPGPIEAVRATGANGLQTIMFAVVPQMISPFVSFSIYRWDINVRMSTVIGLVGGGGIGFLLVQYIRLLDYRAAGIAVWFIAVTVAVLDYVSAEIRARIM